VARIVGTNNNDSLVGTSAADTIEGLAGNDTLVGLAGNDSLIGGTGNDRYVVGTGDLLNDSGGVDTVESTVSWTLGAAFENLTFTGTAVTSGTGNEGNNVMTGNSAGNWMRGRGGDDTMFGGGGNDTFNMRHGASGTYGNDSIDGGSGIDTLDFGATATSAVVINLEAGTARGGGNGGTGSATLVSIENVNGSAFNDVMTGSAAANFLFGFDGNDSLDGAEGADRLEGGAGNDTLHAGHNSSFSDGAVDTLAGGLGDDVYLVSGDDGNNDVILADAGGTDLVIARTSWTLGAGLENLDLEDFFGSSIDGTGNELDNIIRSGSEGGFLRGMGGNDLLIGREVQNSTHLFGGDGNDTLDPRGFGNLFGEAGDDVLLAHGAASQLSGGIGADRFVFGGTGLQYTITDLSSGTDKIHLNAQSMTALGTSGNFQSNDERFHVGASAAEADDRVIWDPSMGELWYDADGSGEGEAGLIAWVSGNVAATDIVVDNGSVPPPPPPPPSGGQTINGTSAPETLTGGAGNDTINGGAGSDRLFGRDGNDTLAGGTEADNMFGENGNDWLDGDAGQDRLTGGAGADSFVFNDALASANADYVNDFVSGSDRLLLDDAIFAKLGGPGSFTAGDERFVAAAGARNGVEADDRLMYDTSTGKLYYDPDGLGGGGAFIVGVVQGAPTLVATDITVI
jgi:Ca2+-binding RTX toxin-like protein